jgi:putative ATP-dependent endonuclease of OLD family
VTAEEGGNEVQVIASSHSPILASQAPIDSIISIHECDNKVSAVSVCSIDMEDGLKKKLQRFLDATRGELFFARRILMVEGIAETLLLPVLAKLAGGSLKEAAVTVLNADGINFNAFLPLFGAKRLGFPVAILTDGDAAKIGDSCSATAAGLKAKETEIPNLRVEYSEITFEHELARSPGILPLMLEAFKILHPVKGQSLKEAVDKLRSDDEKAGGFWTSFIETRTSKGRFAQELAALLEASNLQAEVVPNYILAALRFLGVIKNEQAGNTAGANPLPESH